MIGCFVNLFYDLLKKFQVVFKVKCGDTDWSCMSGFTV